MAPSRRGPSWKRLLLRGLGLAAIAIVLATQLELDDTLQTVDGREVAGRITRDAGGAWRVEADDGSVHHLRADEVATREAGEARVPAVRWGLSSLAGRLLERPGVLLEVLLLLFATYLLTAWRWWRLCDAVEVRLSGGEAVRLNLIGAFFNTAVPGSTGGDVVKAWYAARETGRGVRAVLAVFADRLSGLVGLALFAGGALLALGPRPGLGSPRLIVGLAIVGLLGGSLVLLSGRLRGWLRLGEVARRLPFHGVIAEGGAALRLYRQQPRALLFALGLSFVNHALAGFAVFLLARGLGIQGVELGTTLALVPIANLFGALPLLPGGWGVGELAFAYLFSGVGLPATEAVSLSIVYRLGMLAVSLPGGVLWFLWRGRPTAEDARHEVEEVEERLESLEDALEQAEEVRP